MTRRRRKSSTRALTSKRPTKGTLVSQPTQSSAPEAAVRALGKPMVWIGALLSAMLVIVGGLAFEYFGSGLNAAPALRATPAFVGSETCASCHQKEAQLWQSSQHQHAMQHATETSVLGDFNDAGFDYFGVHSRFFRKNGKFLVETDGADGKLADFRSQIYFRDRSSAAISRRISRRAVAGFADRLGHAAEGEGRPALVPSLSERKDQARRHSALDQAKPELELHVRRMSFDRRAQKLRRSRGSLRHAFRRDQRRLRGMSWPGLSSCRLGSAQKSWWPFGKATRIQTRDFLCALTSARSDLAASIQRPANPDAAPRLQSCARRSRPADYAMQGAAEFREDWMPGRWLSQHACGFPPRPRTFSGRRADARRGL